MTRQAIALNAGFDRGLVWCRGDSVRYLVVDLAAEPGPRTDTNPKPRLNVGLVLDCSGSMRGSRLSAAKRAMTGVVDRLPEGSALSVVSFASEAQSHAERVEVNAANREDIKRQIDAVVARDSTNLSAGWLRGAELVALEMALRPGASNRVVILSDGRANCGLLDSGSLAWHAGELRKRGLMTSTVGIGDDYEHSRLQVIAEHGGGRMHDAATPDEIVEVLIGELSEMVQVAAEGIEVEINCHPEVEIRALGGYPCERVIGKAVCSLGSLLSGARRPLILKVTCPSGTVGDTLPFEIRVKYRSPGSTELIVTDPLTCGLTFATGNKNTDQPRDGDRSLQAARVWQAHIVRRVSELNSEEMYTEASEYLERESHFFRRYCAGLRGAERLVDELELMRESAGRPWSPRHQKEVFRAAASRAKHEIDHRSARRPRWSSYLTEQPDQR